MKRVLATLAAVGALAIVNATPAHAYYYTRSCSVASGAKLTVSNWDITGGQRYHINQDGAGSYYAGGVWIDGVRYYQEEFYKNFSDYGNHTFTGRWNTSWFTYPTCSFSL